MAAVPLDTSHVADPGLCGPDHPVLTVPGPGRSGRGRGDRQMVRGQPPPRMTPECQQVFGKFSDTESMTGFVITRTSRPMRTGRLSR